jgi:hypothetical protein
MLHDEIVADATFPVAVYKGGATVGVDATQDPMTVDADAVCVPTELAPNGGELSALVAVAAAHDPTGLPCQKKARALEVDGHTQALIGAGLTYQGKLFSMSTAAQHNWLAVKAAGAAAGLSYPYKVPVMSNSGYYTATDEAAMIAVADAMRDRIADVVEGGAVLKADIWDAADQAALDAVVDTRT